MSTSSPPNKHSDKNKAVLLGIAAVALLGIVGYETFREKDLYESSPVPPKFSLPNIPPADVESEALRIKMAQMNEKLNEMKRLLFVRGQAPDASSIRQLGAELQEKNHAIEELKELIAAKEKAADVEKTRMTTLEHSLSALADLIEIQRSQKENYHANLQNSVNLAKNQSADELQVHVEEIQALNEKIMLQKQQITALTESLESELHLKKQDISEFNQALEAASHQYAGLIDESLIEKTLHSMQAFEAINAGEEQVLAYKNLTEQLERQVALLNDELEEIQFGALKEKLDLADAIEDKEFLLQQTLNELNEVKAARLAERQTLFDSGKEKEENLLAEQDSRKATHELIVQNLQATSDTLKKELEEAQKEQEKLKSELMTALHDLESTSGLNEHLEALLKETSFELDEMKQSHIAVAENEIALNYAGQQETEYLQNHVAELGVTKQVNESRIDELQKECEELKKDLADSKGQHEILKQELYTALNHLDETSSLSDAKDSLLSEAQGKHLAVIHEKELLGHLLESLDAAKQAEEALAAALKKELSENKDLQESLRQDLADAFQNHAIEKEDLKHLVERLDAAKQTHEATVETLQKELTDSKELQESLRQDLVVAFENHVKDKGELERHLQERIHDAKHAEENIRHELGMSKDLHESLRLDLASNFQHHIAEKDDLENLILTLDAEKQADEAIITVLQKELAMSKKEQEDLEQNHKRYLEAATDGREGLMEAHKKELAENIYLQDSLRQDLADAFQNQIKEKEDFQRLIHSLDAAKQDQEAMVEALQKELVENKEMQDSLRQDMAAALEQHVHEKETIEGLFKRQLEAASQTQEALLESHKRELAEHGELQDELRQDLAAAFQNHVIEKEDLQHFIDRLDLAKQSEESKAEALQKELAMNKEQQDSLRQDLASAFQQYVTEKEDFERLVQQRLDAAKKAQEALIESHEKELAENKTMQDSLRQDLASAFQHYVAEKEDLEQSIQHLDTAKQNHETLAETLQKDLAESKQQQESLRQDMAEAFRHYVTEKEALEQNVSQRLDFAKQAEENLQKELEISKTDHHSTKQELASALENLDSASNLRIEEHEKHLDLAIEKSGLESQIKQLQNDLKQTEESLIASSNSLNSLLIELNDKTTKLDEEKQERESLAHNLKTLHSTLEKERDQAKQIQSSLEKMQRAYEKAIAIQDIDNPEREVPYFEDPTSNIEEDLFEEKQERKGE